MAIDNQLFYSLKMLAALGCGLIAGLFFAFSVVVMPALARLQAAQAISAMQTINTVVLNPLFLTSFFGTAIICLILVLFTSFRWHQPGAIYLLIGSLLYLFGTILVTIIFNVSLNDKLARAETGNAADVHLWNDYLTNWTRWNHIRAIAAFIAAALITIACSY